LRAPPPTGDFSLLFEIEELRAALERGDEKTARSVLFSLIAKTDK
jgi:hypothetical protein